MRSSIIIATNKKGARTVKFYDNTSIALSDYKANATAVKDTVELELWSSDRGRVKSKKIKIEDKE